MTEAEVEAVFGCPPGEYNRRPLALPMTGVLFKRWWASDEAVVIVRVAPEDLEDRGKPWRVTSMTFDPLPPETFRERCRRRVPW
jgi:hypothetical protein